MAQPSGPWVRSSFCADQLCVEVATAGEEVIMRDGKRPDQPYLRFSREDWRGFLHAVAAGDYGNDWTRGE
jgi:hypothetical protein